MAKFSRFDPGNRKRIKDKSQQRDRDFKQHREVRDTRTRDSKQHLTQVALNYKNSDLVDL